MEWVVGRGLLLAAMAVAQSDAAPSNACDEVPAKTKADDAKAAAAQEARSANDYVIGADDVLQDFRLERARPDRNVAGST